ncbi:HEPN domain-containing protein [Streptomyces sp. NPDC091972]|uniref:ApeA N-terminal domain 1-containing protein n=1 Tax=Streptomyces sp. NPDC091972 TaxID=3366007 RepID=UPI0038219518
MEPFESEGLFWLPEAEEQQIAGKISFTHSEGVKLYLIGGFSEFQSFTNLNDVARFPIIHGVAGKRYLTLQDCTRSSYRIEFPGMLREDYRAVTLFAGQTLLTSDDQHFTEVTVRFNNLWDWTQRTIISQNYTFDSDSKLTSATLTLTPLETEEHEIAGGKLALISRWNIPGGQQQDRGFEQDFSLRLTYDDPVDLAHIRNDVATLQDLISATSDSACLPTDISLWITEESDGSTETARLNLYGQQSAQSMTQKSNSVEFLLHLDEIGGLPAIGRWLDFLRDRRIVLGLALSSRYRAMYVENKFFNAVSSAETLHRMEFPNHVMPTADYKEFRDLLVGYVPEEHRRWLKEQLAFSNEPRLRGRIKELAEFCGLPAVLECDADQWARAVTNTRNRMVHHDDRKGPRASNAQFYWMSESLQLLVLLCLAKFCKFQDGYLAKIKASDTVDLIARRVRELLDPKKANDSA